MLGLSFSCVAVLLIIASLHEVVTSNKIMKVLVTSKNESDRLIFDALVGINSPLLKIQEEPLIMMSSLDGCLNGRLLNNTNTTSVVTGVAIASSGNCNAIEKTHNANQNYKAKAILISQNVSLVHTHLPKPIYLNNVAIMALSILNSDFLEIINYTKTHGDTQISILSKIEIEEDHDAGENEEGKKFPLKYCFIIGWSGMRKSAALLLESSPIIYKQADNDDLEGELCIICSKDFEEGDRLRFLSCCKNTLHTNCVEPWLILKSSCPYCKTILSDDTMC
eukprot:Awhi_evm2s6988